MFVVYKTGIKIAILAHCIVFAIYAFKAGTNNWLLETKFASEVVMGI